MAKHKYEVTIHADVEAKAYCEIEADSPEDAERIARNINTLRMSDFEPESVSPYQVSLVVVGDCLTCEE